jgi:predicted choloylglycine hydrolase
MTKHLTLRLQGDHYSMGKQHGSQVSELRPLIVEAIEILFQRIEQDAPDERFEFLVSETNHFLKNANAPILGMIRGLSDSLDLEYERLLRYTLMGYLRDYLCTRPMEGEGCTTWAASGLNTTDQFPILIKNRDYRPEHLPLQVVIHAAPENGHRYLCVGSAGSPGVVSAGINEVGLAVADTHVCSTDLGPGYPDCSLMMHLLERYDHVDAAANFLKSETRMGRNNLILVDEQGALVVFEIGHLRCGLIRARNGSLVNTNHFMDPAMTGSFVDLSPPGIKGNTYHRYAKVKNELQKSQGSIDTAFSKRLMATHAGPLESLCRHEREDSDTITISTTILLPVQRKMLFNHGYACQADYTEYSL